MPWRTYPITTQAAAMDNFYDPNPERGCGRKRQGYYLESGPGSAGGSLSLVTLVTGDFVDDGENILCRVPPRGVHQFYPTDTFRLGELQMEDTRVSTPESRRHMEQVWFNGTRRVGLIDHVDQEKYSPVSFIKELHEYGASRRVSKDMAHKVNALMKILGGSVPIFFTHEDIPLFYDERRMNNAVAAACTIWGSSSDRYFYPASYMHKNWGMRRTKWGGIWEEVPSAQYLIMAAMEAAWGTDDDNPRYDDFRFATEEKNCTTHEQLFCSSWIRQVSYATESGEVPQDVINHGLTVIDISGDEEE